jgi:hypothetical protein
MKCGVSRIARRHSHGVRASIAVISLGFLLVAGGCGTSTGVGAGEEDTPTITAEEIELLILEKAKGQSQKVSLTPGGTAADRDASLGCS